MSHPHVHTPTTRRAPAPPPDERLESWKAIAGHLNRDVRTVQRWERGEGLPVHRHAHDQRGTVFALRAELDAWLASRTESPAPFVPEPVRATSTASSRRLRGAGVALFAAVAAAGALWIPWRSVDRPAVPARQRMIVLPLEALGPDPVSEPVSHGFLEDIINRVSALDAERLVVLGRTSSLTVGASRRSPAQIGRDLGVAHVLEGSLKRQGESLLVTARLLDAAREEPIWTFTKELDARDLRGAERELSGAIARAVARELLDSERDVDAEPAFASATSERAHDAWLRGRYLWNKGTGDGFAASIEHFEAALVIDPDYVDAHVGLAYAYNMLGRYGHRAPGAVFPQGAASARRAIELAPNNAEAHAALALVSCYYEWDFERAAEEFQLAIALRPGLALGHHGYAHFLSAMGLHDAAIEQVRVAQELEPLWPLVTSDAAWFYFRARRYDEAIEACRRALELEPSYSSALTCLVSSLCALGREDLAWSELYDDLGVRGLRAAVGVTADTTPANGLDAYGRYEVAELERRAEKRYVSPFAQVFTRASTGDTEGVLDWLERGVRARDRIAVLMGIHPALDAYRDEPRFQRLLREVGVPADPTALLER